MSLINCPECQHNISDKAVSCPECGCPQNHINNYVNQSYLVKQFNLQRFDDTIGKILFTIFAGGIIGLIEGGLFGYYIDTVVKSSKYNIGYNVGESNSSYRYLLYIFIAILPLWGIQHICSDIINKIKYNIICIISYLVALILSFIVVMSYLP